MSAAIQELPPGPAPVYITLTQRPSQVTEGGVLSGASKHVYVKLSALPDELKKRVTEAIKMIASQR